MAATPPILAGGGGIDVSVGPLMGFVNAIVFTRLIPLGLSDPWAAVPLLLGVGALVGAVNGLLVVVVRLQAIVATLGTYLVLVGLTLQELPQPGGGAPGWMDALAGSLGPVPGAVVLVALPALGWWWLRRTALYRALMAVGGDDRAAFSAGVNVGLVRFSAYVMSGLLAALAGIALTALVGSGDPTLGPPYTLVAIAAAALGGTSLAGGRGGLAGSILAALVIYLIQNLLPAIHASGFWLQIAYGGILLVALVLNTRSRRRLAGRPA
jgi:ribose transport system permease protein